MLVKKERFEALADALARACPDLSLLREEPMSRHTSFRIGGPAALMALPRSARELRDAWLAARAEGLRAVIMGNGSNLLAPDEGLPALVIKTFDGLNEISGDGASALTAGSGVLLSRLAVLARERGLAGLEFAHGIPGTVGGAVCMNAGAYDGQMQDVAAETLYLDEDGAEQSVTGAAHDFAYRHSVFSEKPGILLQTRFSLKADDPAAIEERMRLLAARRRESQPLELPSAGSVFKRPPGHFAAALIDQCGLRGRAVGGAQVSEKHAGFIVNRGGATCGDVLRLIELVRETVFRGTGIALEPEIKLL